MLSAKMYLYFIDKVCFLMYYIYVLLYERCAYAHFG